MRPGPSQASRHHLLLSYATGDWRREGVFEHYVPPGVEVDEEQLRLSSAKAMVLALAPALFKVYPRHRWVGCDIATDQVLLAQCVHGLGSACFLEICGDLQATQADAADNVGGFGGDAVEEATVPLDPEVMTQTAIGAGGTLHEAPGLQQEVEGAEAAAGAACGPLDPSREATAYAQEIARRKRVAMAFYKSQPLGRLILLRLCLKPHLPAPTAVH